jgi:hypothetical protein
MSISFAGPLGFSLLSPEEHMLTQSRRIGVIHAVSGLTISIDRASAYFQTRKSGGPLLLELSVFSIPMVGLEKNNDRHIGRQGKVNEATDTMTANRLYQNKI